MTTIADVIGWKFNHQPGMRCAEAEGVLRIVEFPGGIPSAEDQAAWTAEFEAWRASGGAKDAEAQKALDEQTALKALALVLVDKGVLSLAELRAKYRSLI